MDQKTHHYFGLVQAYHLGIAMLLVGEPNFIIIIQSPSRLTVSNALVRSTKQTISLTMVQIVKEMLCTWPRFSL